MEQIQKIDWDKFKILVKKLIEYKTKSSYVPIRAENWEEVLYVVFAHMFMEGKVGWDPVSHAKGVDLIVQLNGDTLRVSAKGGKIKNQTLSISSYRLTRYESLEEKLEFLGNNAQELDVYLICSREEKEGTVNYRILKIAPNELTPPIFLNPSSWLEDHQGWVFQQTTTVGFEARIVKKMSHQLWYHIPLAYKKLERLCDISLSKQSIGRLLHEVLKSGA